MLKRIFCLVGWFPLQPSQLLLATLLLMVHSLSAQAEPENLFIEASPSLVPSSQTSIEVPVEVPEEIAPDMTEQLELVQIDPLDSPHPIPWNWVLATHAELSESGDFGSRYYRSQSLVSPDGRYAAYSRIHMQGQPELYRSRVTSVMFLENLQTGDLRTITPSSPLAENPMVSNQEADMPGTIAIIIPVSWSQESDRILARQFEGLFSTSDASDYAVIWDRQQNRTSTLAPERIEYSNAVLLGWSQTNPDQVLFRAGELGDEHWPVWAVDLNGQTALALDDEPVVYGQVVNQVWAGPQASW
jgi:hypothetical protein